MSLELIQHPVFGTKYVVADFTFWIPFKTILSRKKKETGFKKYFWNTLKMPPLWKAESLPTSLRQFSLFLLWFDYSSNEVGASPKEFEGLCLFYYLFRQEVFFRPRFDLGSSQGYIIWFRLLIFTEFQFQKSFASKSDRYSAWGLKNGDMKFLRLEIRTLLFKYLKQGDAVVEFQ